MIPEKILEGYLRLKKAGLDVQLSNTYRYLLIRNIKLPSKFSQSYTDILIENDPYSDYKVPKAYVDRRLKVWKPGIGFTESMHLDELLTPIDMLEKGWVRLCFKAKWDPSYSIVDFVIMVLNILREL